ncbi:glutamate synthase [Ectothiorhodospiraceae bacterium BW-2]|nr:glutamate synthase [Ectothiorhodospiraceae bacterium BW-2]
MQRFIRGGYANPATSLNYHTGTWRIEKPHYRESSAPCHHACPAGENARLWLGLVDEGRFEAAWQAIVAVNPLPAVTGRVCHHPCESACNRGEFDQPLAIHHMERYLGDLALEQGWELEAMPPLNGSGAVAVVGAGPSGLSAAYHLRRLGYRVDIFDAAPEAGGTLLSALPHYRLPRSVLNQEVERILRCDGILFHPHERLGETLQLDKLCDDFAAVYLALGLQQPTEWSVDGVTPRDLHSGIDMLKAWMDVGNTPDAASVAIIGGGNTAIDMARIMRRSGGQDVHIITDQSLPDSGEAQVMSAIAREVSQALEEGVQIHPNRGIRRLILRGERVVGIEMVHMRKLHSAASGYRRVAFEGTETVLHVDMVIPAIGQQIDMAGIELLPLTNGRIALQSDGRVKGFDNLFAGGDMAPDCGTVTEAVGYGRRTALAMDRYLRQLSEATVGAEPAVIAAPRLNFHYFESAARVEVETLAVAERLKGCIEIEQGLTEHQAKTEAERCLSCGSCIHCDNCWTLCPDMAVLKDPTPGHAPYLFDYDYCKGCGLCANECPCGYIVMESDL